MKYLWLTLVLFVLPLNAEIYRLQDENGRVIYSDQFHPDAELVNVPKPASYRPPVINNAPDKLIEEGGLSYEISISSPQENEAIWGNDGNLPVSVELQPELNIEEGQQLMISLDGMTLGEPQSSTDFIVPIIERGAHTISVSIINQAGVTLATSQAVNFQLHRASAGN
ncbi:MAG: DUF4124 domain-containing protein [Methylophagaceae bacterium]